jgi:hypothetical protein
VVGLAIANALISQVDHSFPALCFNAIIKLKSWLGRMSQGTIQGVAGNQLLIADGTPVTAPKTQY